MTQVLNLLRRVETLAAEARPYCQQFNAWLCGRSAAVQLGLSVPILAFVSAAIVGVLGLRMARSHHWEHAYLVWNLFLAWLPLLFALRLCRVLSDSGDFGVRPYAMGFCWLIFFPNAPYIFTDLIHLGSRHRGHYWLDLVLILLFAMAGLVLGFLSLYLVQSQVAKRFGWLAGWIFSACVAGLSGVGIYLGRFLRWNSWDVLLNPVGLTRDVLGWLANPLDNRSALLHSPLFALFVFLAYLMWYGLVLARPSEERGLGP